MKKAIIALSFCIVTGSCACAELQLGFQFNSRSADSELEFSLNNLNHNARGDIDSFSTRMNVTYGVPKREVHNLIIVEKLDPADVYMAVKLSKMTKRPVREIVRRRHGRGWGVLAHEMGIKPGSREFKELKGGADVIVVDKTTRREVIIKDHKGKETWKPGKHSSHGKHGH
ncbi:MAG: hypothetical protein DKM50_08340 [Candidatus Margulisiibacteriota bacterium]|nr:MAG: hypothetical protein A2X43_03120 [Candidatus Margulisbacteria bacterium GWD2_39_127]OGI05004.1 MAG: hypothetical protein A2X42_05385 [Candidatus Margulisbacteria bacterium GWF2_38_17]OGI09000.1 MAG: hypothetical protein A2X41_01580 [Candidatus Margulisbacteria bacterium GWE2_39_32]PZM79604.1 MAG: hypothetical protein DKM50_08340 [Candidatus Margulisiibacteriota bacterium]HAR63214.1 hypothetical protein [Candidatus Margulisiibacteriota bacterium]